MMLSRAQLHRLRQIARGRSDEALTLLDGPKAVHDALAGGDVAEVWIREGESDALVAEVRRRAAASGVPVGEGSAEAFDRLGHVVTPQGVFALVRDTALALDVLVARDGLLLWLDGVQDPGNVGAVLRVAAAFDVAGVLVGAGTADPLGQKALRASAGLALRVPFARAPSHVIAAAVANRTVWSLEREGQDIFALASGADPSPRNVVLVLGSEGHGPGDDARAAADAKVGIPIAEDVESLNVAVAAGIAVAVLTRTCA